jgi:hypothetical protein
MRPRRQDGRRAAHGWIGALAQRVGDGPSQAGQANQYADHEGVEIRRRPAHAASLGVQLGVHRQPADDALGEIAAQHWLVFATAQEQATAVGIRRALQHACGDLVGFTSCCCCFRR